MISRSKCYISLVFVLALAAGGRGAFAQEDPISLGISASATCICAGGTVTLTLTASDYDYRYPRECWDNLFFSGWPGPEPVREDNAYHSTWTHTFDTAGKYTYTVTADDGDCVVDDGAVTVVVTIYVAGDLTLVSPTNGMRFIVGPGECDIAIVASIDPVDCPCCTLRWYVRRDGGDWQGKPPMERQPDGKWRARWETDWTERGNWQVKVEELQVGGVVCKSRTASIFCGKPTWPICRDGGTNGRIEQWLHLSGNDRGVDVNITGAGCSGTTPLLAAEDGDASPHQFHSDYHPCIDGDTFCNLVDHGTFNVRLIDATTPTYQSRSLSTDHWHMMPDPPRADGHVVYHQSLGDGGYTGNVTGSHDHFITLVSGTGVSPDRTGAVGEGNYTDCDQQLHPAW